MELPVSSAGGWGEPNLSQLEVLKPIHWNQQKHTCRASGIGSWVGLLTRFGLFMHAFQKKLGPQRSNLNWILSIRDNLLMNNWIFILRGKELKQVRVVTSLKTKKVAATCGWERYLVLFVVVEWLCLYLVPKTIRVASSEHCLHSVDTVNVCLLQNIMVQQCHVLLS